MSNPLPPPQVVKPALDLSLFDSLSDGVVAVNREGKIGYFNSAATTILNTKLSTGADLNMALFGNSPMAERHRGLIEEVFENPSVKQMNRTIQYKGKSLDVQLQPIGGIVLAIIEDRTTQVELQQKLKAVEIREIAQEKDVRKLILVSLFASLGILFAGSYFSTSHNTSQISGLLSGLNATLSICIGYYFKSSDSDRKGK